MQPESKPHAGTRLGSMLLDHIIMVCLMMVFMVPYFVIEFPKALNISHEPATYDIFGNYVYLMFAGFAFYFGKDSIQGRSPAKRLLSLQVVDHKTGAVASPLQCLVRNLFCALWPFEVLVTIFSPGRRIGDFVAGTRVIVFDPAREQQTLDWRKIGLAMTISYGVVLIMAIPYYIIRDINQGQRVKIDESAYNERESLVTKQLLADSLGNYMTPDVRVYDRIDGSDLKYVSVIFELKENYIGDNEGYNQARSMTEPIILSKFPEGTFVGQFQYVYRSASGFQSRSHMLDWRKDNELGD